MKGWALNLSSLFIALVLLLGILFLPEATYKPITDTLGYFSKATNALFAFGSHVIGNFLSAIITGILTYLIILIFKKEE